MTPDPFDDLLDRSAPASGLPRKGDFEAMIADAQKEVPRARRTPRLVVAGAVVFLFAGGTGVAAATDGFTWAPWAEDPVGAVSFEMENGFDCEIRWSEYTAGSYPLFLHQVNRILEDWYRSADVVAAAGEFVPAELEEYGPIRLEPGETLDALPPGEPEHRAWIREWTAWDFAISDAEYQELSRHGIEPGDDRFAGSERSGQIQCRDVDHQPYVPGAGS